MGHIIIGFSGLSYAALGFFDMTDAQAQPVYPKSFFLLGGCRYIHPSFIQSDPIQPIH
jgi:hypothetical protein